jgi:hypothetical protein
MYLIFNATYLFKILQKKITVGSKKLFNSKFQILVKNISKFRDLERHFGNWKSRSTVFD